MSLTRSIGRAALAVAAVAFLFLSILYALKLFSPSTKPVAESFAGVWIEAENEHPNGRVIEYSGGSVKVETFVCEVAPPSAASSPLFYPAQAGTLLGDLCLGRMRPHIDDGPGSVPFVSIDKNWESRVRNGLLEMRHIPPPTPDWVFSQWEMTADGKGLRNANKAKLLEDIKRTGINPSDFHEYVRFQLAFAVITPKSLDGRTGKLEDTGALDFANQVVGTKSDSLSVTIRNVSEVPLEMGKVHLEPHDLDSGPGPFSFDSSDCNAKKVLPPNGKCAISVQFTPITPDSELGARELVIESNAEGSPHRVALTGTGTRGTGTALVPKPFSSSASYAVGDLVRYSTSTQATIYRAIESNSGPNNLTPDKNPSAWAFVARSALGSDTIARPKGTTVPRLVVDRAESGHSVFNLCATPSVPLPKFAGWQREEGLSWALSQSNPVRELWGQVVQGHVTSADAFFNHNAIDYNFFVYPDPSFRGLLANPGNFDTGDEFEKGRIEVEWERATPMWKGGLPDWAWPAQGDRVYVVGNFIRDCGHGEFSGGYRTEIHPPRLVVTYRNAALADFGNASGRWGSNYNGHWATRVDVFVSNYGGKALASEGVDTSPWQRIGGKEYRFVVRAPPRPSPKAELKEFFHPHEKSSAASYDWLDCKPKVSTEDSYDCTIRLPADVATERDVYLGETIYVFWEGSAADAKPAKLSNGPEKAASAFPDVRSYALTATAVEVLHAGGGKWGLYGHVNEKAASLLVGDGQTVFGERYAEVKETARNAKVSVPPLTQFANPTFNVSIIEGQPLHLQFRVIIYDALIGNNSMGGIAEAYYRREDEKTWLSTELSTRGYGTMNVGSEQSELDPACNDAGCFIVRYKIEKLQ